MRVKCEQTVTLAAHPQTPGDAVRGIEVRVSRQSNGMLALSYRIDADLERLCIPAPGAGSSKDPLWQHTCCEIFIRRHGAAAYHEFNFSPSGAWAAYAFERYREGGPLAHDALDLDIAVTRGQHQLELDAAIRLDRLSALHALARIDIGLSAVIEQRGGVLSYWALAHPVGKPDFHHAHAFALELGNE